MDQAAEESEEAEDQAVNKGKVFTLNLTGFYKVESGAPSAHLVFEKVLAPLNLSQFS